MHEQFLSLLLYHRVSASLTNNAFKFDSCLLLKGNWDLQCSMDYAGEYVWCVCMCRQWCFSVILFKCLHYFN